MGLARWDVVTSAGLWCVCTKPALRRHSERPGHGSRMASGPPATLALQQHWPSSNNGLSDLRRSPANAVASIANWRMITSATECGASDARILPGFALMGTVDRAIAIRDACVARDGDTGNKRGGFHALSVRLDNEQVQAPAAVRHQSRGSDQPTGDASGDTGNRVGGISGAERPSAELGAAGNSAAAGGRLSRGSRRCAGRGTR